ncbi:MAG: J domain-containing protein [Bdellovibrionales bacterium]|nr:J domain-containing protein [Bdellovibrionales bacterium]
MAKPDFYFILGIDQKATANDIKRAYRQLALKYHPDHNPNNSKAEDRFKKILEAYETLSNPELRKQYDELYKPSPRPSQTGGDPPKPKAGASSSPRPPKKHLRYNVFVTLEEITQGCEKTIRYMRDHNGEKETIQLKVKIPKGAQHQQRLRVNQFGGGHSQDKGDLIVVVHIQNHPVFQRDGLNISVNVPINYLQALTGAIIEVPTLEGVEKIRLRQCQFEDLRFSLDKKGLPDLKTSQRGKLDIFCFIEHPKKTTGLDKNALQKLLNSWPQGEMMQQYHEHIQQMKGQ